MAVMDYTIEREFDVIAALSERAIEASIRELRERDRLTIALRTAMRNGADINELSAQSGLTPADIRDRCGQELNILSELEFAVGMV